MNSTLPTMIIIFAMVFSSVPSLGIEPQIITGESGSRWPMYRHDSMLTGNAPGKGKIGFPNLMWKFSGATPNQVTQCVVEDVVNDTLPEMVCTFMGDLIYVFDGSTGSVLKVLKPFPISDGITGLTLGDINGDNKSEILTIQSNKIYAISYENGILWETSTKRDESNSHRHPIILSNIDGDGKEEVVYRGAIFESLNGNFRYMVDGTIDSATGDLNNDGLDEIITISSEYITATQGNGSILWKKEHYLMYSSSSEFAYFSLSDFNGDGIPDIAVSGRKNNNGINTVRLFNGKDGSILWDILDRYEPSSGASIADLNSDGIKDIVAFSGDWVYAFTGENGAILWQAFIGNKPNDFPVIGDINGDNVPEILFTKDRTMDENTSVIYILDGKTGNRVWTLSVNTTIPGSQVLLIADLDDDGLLEFVVKISAYSPQIMVFGEGGQSPVAVIDSVVPEPSFLQEIVNFTGHGESSSGRNIVAYQWFSNLSGLLSDKASFSCNNLTMGNHQIYFRVKDNIGVWSPYVSIAHSVLNVSTALIPDATITEISLVPIVPAKQEKFTMNVKIMNIGNLSIDSARVGLFHREGSLPQEEKLSENLTSLIEPGKIREIQFRDNSLSYGEHYLTIRIRDVKPYEFNTSNNDYAMKIVIFNNSLKTDYLPWSILLIIILMTIILAFILTRRHRKKRRS